MYIDTEGSFMEERAKDIASSFVTHVHKMAGIRADEESEEGIRNLTVHFSPWVFSFFCKNSKKSRKTLAI